jgi:hypothetical protein
MKKIIFLIFPIFLFGCTSPKVLSIRDNPAQKPSPAKANFVQIDAGRFSPESIELKKGNYLTIENSDSSVWTIAADPHPDHSTLGRLFKVLHKNGQVGYQFNNTGSFGVHLEENPSVKLKILVK